MNHEDIRSAEKFTVNLMELTQLLIQAVLKEAPRSQKLLSKKINKRIRDFQGFEGEAKSHLANIEAFMEFLQGHCLGVRATELIQDSIKCLQEFRTFQLNIGSANETLKECMAQVAMLLISPTPNGRII
ncbi:hypothetical protein ACFL2R_04395 [Patescibacteria group bacterium]